ncbi:MAG TPA: hypothetical protein OIM11_01305 [Coriobacteriaceae bacterium]|nr:hypothetical protein [Coriobacteriaceae bacterium]
MKKLSALSLSLVLALSMTPITAFAAGGAGAQNDASDLLVAQQATREIRLVSGVSTEELTISSGETIDFVFNLDKDSTVGFVLYQKYSSGERPLNAVLKGANSDSQIFWQIPKSTQTFEFYPFYLNAGEQHFQLTSFRDVTIYLTMESEAHQDMTSGYEMEPNNTSDFAMPIQVGRTYLANTYNPDGEEFAAGKAEGVTGNDTDWFSFTVDAVSDVNIPFVTTESIYYAVRREMGGDPSPIKAGETAPGNSSNIINCGRLEAGTYYLQTSGNGDAWKKGYAFSIMADPIDDPAPDNPSNPTDPDRNVAHATTNSPLTDLAWTGSPITPKPTIELDGVTLKEGKDYTLSYENNIDEGKGTIYVNGMGDYTGSRKFYFTIKKTSSTPPGDSTSDPKPDDTDKPDASDPEPVSTETMYRLYNPNSGEHFYTSSPVERQAVIEAGWNDEGVGWTAPTSGIKVYRLYNSFAGEHHYTTSEAERDMLVGVGWTWEEGGWYSDPNEAVPLYRAYNPNAYANNHHYTLDWGEFQTLLSLGWVDEGVGWHGVK